MSLAFVHVKFIFLLGSTLCFFGVGLGAMGTHMLKNSISSDFLNLFEVGVRYQLFHSLGILVGAGFFVRWKILFFKLSGYLFLCGTLLFSGSLYMIAFTGEKFFGKITPFGGICFLLGWLSMFYAFLKIEKDEF